MNMQTTEKAYRENFDAFMAIDKESLVYCTVPLDVVTAEGAALALAAAQDAETLQSAGLAQEILDSLTLRVEALTYAAARYQMAIEMDPEATRRWKEESGRGYELKQYLLRFYEFAFRGDPERLESVVKIRAGRGHQDMVLDLLSLSIFGTENAERLAAIPMFDKTKVEEAKVLHETLSDLLARSSIDPKEVSEAKNILHHAYTHYKQADPFEKQAAVS